MREKFQDSKGGLHATPEKATLEDLAAVLGRVGDEGGMTAGVAKLIFENRLEIERIFAEHDSMIPRQWDRREGDAPVADAAEDDAAEERLALVGRDGAPVHELVADELDRLDFAVAVDRDGRSEETQADSARLPRGRSRRVVAEMFDVALDR